MHVKRAVIATKPGRREGQHRAQPLAAGLNQMGGDLRDTRRMLRGHPLADQCIHTGHVTGKPGCQPVLWFFCHLIQTSTPKITAGILWLSVLSTDPDLPTMSIP
jgi:hypothetical protein